MGLRHSRRPCVYGDGIAPFLSYLFDRTKTLALKGSIDSTGTHSFSNCCLICSSAQYLMAWGQSVTSLPATRRYRRVRLLSWLTSDSTWPFEAGSSPSVMLCLMRRSEHHFSTFFDSSSFARSLCKRLILMPVVLNFAMHFPRATKISLTCLDPRSSTSVTCLTLNGCLHSSTNLLTSSCGLSKRKAVLTRCLSRHSSDLMNRPTCLSSSAASESAKFFSRSVNPGRPYLSWTRPRSGLGPGCFCLKRLTVRHGTMVTCDPIIRSLVTLLSPVTCNPNIRSPATLFL